MGCKARPSLRAESYECCTVSEERRPQQRRPRFLSELLVGTEVGLILFPRQINAIDIERVLPLEHIGGVGQEDPRVRKRFRRVANEAVEDDEFLPERAEIDDVT